MTGISIYTKIIIIIVVIIIIIFCSVLRGVASQYINHEDEASQEVARAISWKLTLLTILKGSMLIVALGCCCLFFMKL